MNMLRKIFHPGNYPKSIDLALLILRVVVCITMLSHGTGKWEKLFGDASVKFSDPLGVGVTTSLALAVFAEVICSVFLLAGFATRLSAIPLMITMLVAVLIVHAGDEFREIELALIYTSIYLVLFITGAGKISFDQIIYGRLRS